MREIKRWECTLLEKTKNWLLVYGRRKTGKTFLLRKCVKWDTYLTITKTGKTVVETGKEHRIMTTREAIKNVTKFLKEENTVVIDEVQRVPDSELRNLPTPDSKDNRRLILCGTGLAAVNKVYSDKSPLKGHLTPIKIDLTAFEDAFAAFPHLQFREAAEWATLARDPWILGLIKPEGKASEVIARNAEMLASSATGLLGEIFLEEGKPFNKYLDSMLRLLADGYWSLKDITAQLHQQGITPSPDVESTKKALDELTSIGLVDQIPVWSPNGAQTYYRHMSSLIALLLYVDERYLSAGLRPTPSAVDARLSLEVQFGIAEVLAKWKNLRLTYRVNSKGYLDVVLASKQEPVIGYEVKKEPFTSNDARKAVKRIKQAGIPRVGLISLKERPPDIADQNLGPAELRNIIRLNAEKQRRQTLSQ